VNQKLGVRLLEKRGHTVSVVGDGEEVLAALARESFDVVLMDVQMPKLDGLEATVLIRRHEARTGRRLPVIPMTAHAMKGARQRCLQAGGGAYNAQPRPPPRPGEARGGAAAGGRGAPGGGGGRDPRVRARP